MAGAPVHLTGLDALSASGDRKGGLGLLLESLLGGGLALLVLAFVFASAMALVPLVIAVISIMTSFLAVWGLTALTPVSSIVEFLIALVGLGVAIDYSLLIIARWREERAHGCDGDQAVVRAMQTAGRAVVFSGTTVAVGLLALVVLPVPFLRSVGYGGLLIPLVSVAVALTLLPVILAGIGPRLDWPHIRSDRVASRAWTRWAGCVVRHRGVARRRRGRDPGGAGGRGRDDQARPRHRLAGRDRPARRRPRRAAGAAGGGVGDRRAEPDRDPGTAARRPARWRSTRLAASGVDGAIAPTDPAGRPGTARSSTCCRSAIREAPSTASRSRVPTRSPTRPRRRDRRSERSSSTSSTPSTAASR